MKLFRTRRWAQFSLRTLLALFTVVAVWGAWQTNRAARQKELVRSLRADGYTVSYDQRGPDWLARLAGIDFLGKVTGIDGYHNRHIDADRLFAIARLRSVRRIQIAINQIDEATFRAIGDMSTLEMLVLSSPPFPPECLAHFSGLDQLEKVYITQPIGDAGITQLCRLPQLNTIEISSERLSQEGIQQLAALQHLKRLELNGNLDISHRTRHVLGSVVIDDGSWHRTKNQRVWVVQDAEPADEPEPESVY